MDGGKYNIFDDFEVIENEPFKTEIDPIEKQIDDNMAENEQELKEQQKETQILNDNLAKSANTLNKILDVEDDNEYVNEELEALQREVDKEQSAESLKSLGDEELNAIRNEALKDNDAIEAPEDDLNNLPPDEYDKKMTEMLFGNDPEVNYEVNQGWNENDLQDFMSDRSAGPMPPVSPETDGYGYVNPNMDNPYNGISFDADTATAGQNEPASQTQTDAPENTPIQDAPMQNNTNVTTNQSQDAEEGYSSADYDGRSSDYSFSSDIYGGQQQIQQMQPQYAGGQPQYRQPVMQQPQYGQPQYRQPVMQQPQYMQGYGQPYQPQGTVTATMSLEQYVKQSQDQLAQLNKSAKEMYDQATMLSKMYKDNPTAMAMINQLAQRSEQMRQQAAALTQTMQVVQQQAQYVQQVYGRPAQIQFVQPAHQYGMQYGAPQYGQPAPQYGQPMYGAPQYNQPQYGQPMPQYNQPQYRQPGMQQPQYRQPQQMPNSNVTPGNVQNQPQTRDANPKVEFNGIDKIDHEAVYAEKKIVNDKIDSIKFSPNGPEFKADDSPEFKTVMDMIEAQKNGKADEVMPKDEFAKFAEGTLKNRDARLEREAQEREQRIEKDISTFEVVDKDALENELRLDKANEEAKKKEAEERLKEEQKKGNQKENKNPKPAQEEQKKGNEKNAQQAKQEQQKKEEQKQQKKEDQKKQDQKQKNNNGKNLDNAQKAKRAAERQKELAKKGPGHVAADKLLRDFKKHPEKYKSREAVDKAIGKLIRKDKELEQKKQMQAQNKTQIKNPVKPNPVKTEDTKELNKSTFVMK